MNTLYLPAYEDGTECSEMSAYKIQTLGNYTEESIQHTVHDENLKPRINENITEEYIYYLLQK